MATLILHSTPLSTYGRTCRMAMAEKGVAYELDPVMPQAPEQLERQPWGSVPAISHGDVRMYEALAICNYVDAAFDGPPLQPSEPLARARSYQWTSVFVQYLYRPAIDIVLQRMFVPAQGGAPDEALVAESVPKAQKALGVLDGALDGHKYFAGDDVSLSDYFVLPVVDYLRVTPEGETLLAATPNLTRWMAVMDGRDSTAATAPPSLG